MENKTVLSVSQSTQPSPANSVLDEGRATMVNPTMVNPSIANASMLNPTMVNEVLVRDAATMGRSRGGSPSEETPITEYNSAVNYISSLIDQLRQASPTPKAGEPKPAPKSDEPTSKSSDSIDSRTTMPMTPTREDATLVLGTSSNPSESPSVPSLVRAMDATLRPEDLRNIIRRKPDEDIIDDDAEADAVASQIDEIQHQIDQEMGREKGRNMLHNLREAAFLATTTSLDLNDCATYAQRAYYSGFFGIASSLFSITFVLMSPRTNSFGFAASVGAFAVAFGLWMAFMISYRLLIRTSNHMRTKCQLKDAGIA